MLIRAFAPSALLAVFFVLAPLPARAQAPDFLSRWVGFDTGFDNEARWPWSFRFGDVDGDGDLDAVIVTGASIPRLSVAKSRGRGVFDPPQHFLTPAGAWDDIVDLELADFDRDGDLDVAIANFGNTGTSARVFVHRNNGAGDFSSFQSFPTGAGPSGITVADFDLDGWPDIATANYGRLGVGTSVSILQNDARGGFRQPQNLTVGSKPYRLGTGDFDGDGRPDLAVAREGQQLDVLRNLTSGWTRTVYPMQPNGYAGDAYPCVEIVDLDRDGDLDLAYTSTKTGFQPSPGTGAVLVSLNDGVGGFSLPLSLPTAGFTQGGVDLCSGDFNLDGWNDLVSTHLFQGEFEIFLSDGQGGFQPYLLRSAGEQTIAIQAQDFEGDGRMDLALLDRNCLAMAILRNDGTGTFEGPPAEALIPAGTGARFAQADFDGDGVEDLALSFAVGSTAGGVQIHRGTAQGLQVWTTVVGPTTVAALAPVDLDLDGRVDLVFADDRSPYAWNFARNLGGGAFASPQSFPGAGVRIGAMAAHDFDLDGDYDVALGYTGTGSTNAGAYIAWNQGGGNFSAVQRFPLSWGLTRLIAADMNQDGRPDLVANSSSNAIEVLLGQPGGFATARSHTVDAGPIDLVVGDWNRDGVPDIATSNRGPGLTHCTLTVALGLGNGSFTATTTLRSGYHIQYFNAGGIVAVDVDGDGDLDLGQAHLQSHDVSFFRNLGNGTFVRDVRYGVGWTPNGLVAGDFDGDGFADLVAGVNPARVGTGITHAVHLRGSGGQPWFSLGFGIPGSSGTPFLEGFAPFQTPLPARLQLRLARPASPALLILGTTRWNVPLAGGLLIPSHDLSLPFVTNAAGAADFLFPFPPFARRRFEIYAQAWVLDPAAREGIAASEGLVGFAN